MEILKMDITLSLEILGTLYEHMYNTDEYDYETVDTFYGYLGYTLELHHTLPQLGINSTSDLQEKLLKRT